MEHLSFSWNEAEDSLRELSKRISDSGFKIDTIIGISRGGLVPARILSDIFNVRDLRIVTVSFYSSTGNRKSTPEILFPLTQTLRGKNVLLVDDVSDSGESFKAAIAHIRPLKPAALKTVSIHMKASSGFRPDFFFALNDKWVVYPWEKEEFFRDTGKRA